MAAGKKSAEDLSKDLEALDKRIVAQEEQLRRLKDSRRKLRKKISEAQADELMDILETHEIPFEAAKDILARARQANEEREVEPDGAEQS